MIIIIMIKYLKEIQVGNDNVGSRIWATNFAWVRIQFEALRNPGPKTFWDI
jgi:hypothetical protein